MHTLFFSEVCLSEEVLFGLVIQLTHKLHWHFTATHLIQVQPEHLVS